MGRHSVVLGRAKLPFLYFALALSHEFDRFSRLEAEIVAENFRFFLFSEI
jgi:hypothetical protein